MATIEERLAAAKKGQKAGTQVPAGSVQDRINRAKGSGATQSGSPQALSALQKYAEQQAKPVAITPMSQGMGVASFGKQMMGQTPSAVLGGKVDTGIMSAGEIKTAHGKVTEKLKPLQEMSDAAHQVENLQRTTDDILRQDYPDSGFDSWEDMLKKKRELEDIQGRMASGFYSARGEELSRQMNREWLDYMANLAMAVQDSVDKMRYGGEVGPDWSFLFGGKGDNGINVSAMNQLEEAKKHLESLGWKREDIDRMVEYQVYVRREQAAQAKKEAMQKKLEETEEKYTYRGGYGPDYGYLFGKESQNGVVTKQVPKDKGIDETAAAIMMAPAQALDFINMRISTSGRNNTGDIDSYKPASVADMPATVYANAVTGTIAKRIEGEKPTLISKAAAFLYQTGMSMAQSTALAAGLGPFSLAVMGGSAAANTALDVIERGGTNNQAFAAGIASGVAEALFEKFSVENLLKGVGDGKFWLSVLKQAGIEASEEMATEIANILSDAAIMGHNSKFNTAVREYMTEEGISEEEAKQKAFLDCVADVGLAGLGGALSGGGSMMLRGGGQMAVSKAVNNARENEFMRQHKAAEQAFAEIEGQKETASKVETESTAVNTDPTEHTPQEQAVIDAYQAGTNDELKELFEEHSANPKRGFSRRDISAVSERQAADAARLLGGDYAGYKNAINSNAVKHILKEHGPEGAVDHSLADMNDAARMGFVLDNYDDVEVVTYESGEVDLSSEFRTKENAPAPMLKFSKKVNGTYYVVEAIPESKYKKFWVVSAYMQTADGGTQALDADGPGNTPNASLASSLSAAETTVPQPGREVNIVPEVTEEDVQRSKRAKNFGMKAGLVRDDNLDKMHLSYKTSSAIDAIAKIAGVQVRVVDKAMGGKANGKYSNGVIELAMDASDPVMTVFIHELVHRIRETSPESYAAMAKFVQQNIGSGTLEALSKRYSVEYGTKEVSEYSEEMVADAFGVILGDSNAMEQFARDDRTALEKVKGVIRDMINAVKRVLSGQNVRLTSEQRMAFRKLESKLTEMERIISDALKSYSEEKGYSEAENDEPVSVEKTGKASFKSDAASWEEAAEVARRENEAQKQGKRLEERAAFQRANVKNATKPGAGELDKIAGGLLKDFSSQYDRKELTAQLEVLYDRLSKGGLSGKALAAEAESLARRMLTEVYIMGEEGAELRRELRQTKIHVPRALWADFEEEGGYTEFRRKYMGKLQLSGETGQSIDEVYEDLSVSYPSVFDMDAVEDPVNRLLQIAEVADSLRFVSENLSATDRVNVELLAGEMVERLYDLAQKGQPLSEVRAKDRKAAQDRLRETMAKRERESARKVESIRKSNREANMRQRERMNTTKMRDSVRKHADALARKLTRPTDKQHIPEHLRGSVLALLEVIDLESKFGYQFTREATFKRVNQSEGELLEPTSRTSAARALKAAYEQLRSDPEFSGVVDPDLADMLEEIAEMGNIRVADMNMEQLQTVWNAVRAVEASVTKSDKMLTASRYNTVDQMAKVLYRVVGGRKDHVNLVGKLGSADRLLELEMLTPETYLHRLGEVGDTIREMMAEAQRRQIEITNEGLEVYRRAAEKYGVDMLKLEKRFKTFELSGGTIELSVAQIMDLYALSRRKAAEEHLYLGGIRARGAAKGLKEVGLSEKVKVTLTDVTDILDTLTQEQKSFIDELQEYMSTQLAAHGNDATMRAYGYEKFKEKYYWTIRVADSETKTDPGVAANSKTIPGFGMTKALKPHAKDSVLLHSALSVYAQHLDQMAVYAAWLTTAEDITRLLNYSFTEGGTRQRTVKDLLQKVYGTGGEAYLSKLLEDIAQGTKKGAESTPTDGMFGAWKGAKVGMNLRVILQQPTSIVRAAEMIDPQYIVAGMKPDKGWKKALEWSAIAKWKDWGYFELDNGRSMRELLAGSNAIGKAKNISMWAAGKMDSMTWGALWNAVEAETRAKHKELKVGSDEYYRFVAKRFDAIIDRTQVVDSVLHRTQIMRSSNALHRMATSFMSEPSKVYNMVARDIYDIRNAGKGSEEQKRAWKHMARTSVSLVASFLVNALAQSVVDAMRDDDRDKSYGEKFKGALLGLPEDDENGWQRWTSYWEGNFLNNFDPFGYIPYVKDVRSLVQGFSIDRPDMEGLANLAQVLKDLFRSLSGEGKKTNWNTVLNAVCGALDLAGLPGSNLKRDLMAIYSSVLQWTRAHWMTYQLDKTMLKIGESGNRSVFCATLMRAMNDDYDAYVKIYNDMVKSGMSPEDIEMGMDRQMAAELGLTKLSLLPIDWKAPGKDAAFDKKVKSRIESEKSWEEIVGGEYLGLLRELDALKAEDGKTSVTDAQKRRHIANANYSERIKEQAMERVLGFGTAANGRYVKARSAGISTKAFVDLLDAIEAATVARKGEKGSPNQDDVEKALNKSALTAAQKRAVWYSYGWKSESPWG